MSAVMPFLMNTQLHEVMHCPRTIAEWKTVAAEFSSWWNFHHTLGAIDGKHVAIRCPRNGRSLYFISVTRVSTQSFCLPLWMPTTGSCGWMWAPMDLVLIRGYLTSHN